MTFNFSWRAVRQFNDLYAMCFVERYCPHLPYFFPRRIAIVAGSAQIAACAEWRLALAVQRMVRPACCSSKNRAGRVNALDFASVLDVPTNATELGVRAKHCSRSLKVGNGP
jgi:hypothetical protein